MKVTVLPWLDVANYGSVLQIFAVQKVLEQYADEVEIINYKHNARFAEVLSGNPMRAINNALSYIFINNNFREIEAHLNLTKEEYRTEDDFKSNAVASDLYCTGSDQVWNLINGPDVFGARFLSFLPDGARRFAFSSSFGDRASDETVNRSKDWIDKFERISVREDIGLNIIEKQYGYHGAVQLVDPTLALPPGVWRSYAPKPRLFGPYILIYDIMDNKEFYAYAKKLSKTAGMPLVHLCHRFSRVFYCGKSVLFPPVLEFITLIDNAALVLTGSFHATAFAMSLNTPPVCVYHSRNPGRLASFLRLINAEHRAIKNFDDLDVIYRDVDFNRVNKILEQERVRVDAFLSGIFNIGV